MRIVWRIKVAHSVSQILCVTSADCGELTHSRHFYQFHHAISQWTNFCTLAQISCRAAMLHPSWGERGHAAHSMQATYTTLAFRFYMCSTIEPLDKKCIIKILICHWCYTCGKENRVKLVYLSIYARGI